MAHSPHKRWKGCALCKPQKWKSQGPRHTWRFRDLRSVGTIRRTNRHYRLP